MVAEPIIRPYRPTDRAELLPGFAERYPYVERPETQEDVMVNLGHPPERMLIPELDEYPAHLHIDLLPELQGLGMGRRLVDTLLASLAASAGFTS